MEAIAWIVLGALSAFCGALIWLFRSSPRLRPCVSEGAVPLVSVVVPMRNEERNAAACIQGLWAQDYPSFEVIVVDDGSTDRTAEILTAHARPELRVLVGRPLPHGWGGKNHALHQGAQVARGEWLLFLDADVVLEPGALCAAVREARTRDLALLSLWPRHLLHGFWEQAVQGFIFVMHLFGDAYQRLHQPWTRSAGPANGQFLLVSRAAYQRIGGHRAVRGAILEDFEISLRLRRSGFAIGMFQGGSIASVRMYASLDEIWSGWSKNTYLGLRSPVLETLGAGLVVLTVGLGPLALALAAVAGVPAGGAGPTAAYAFATWAIWVATGLVARHQVRTTVLSLVAVPLAAVVLFGILVNSAYRHRTGRGVRWKGRTYGRATGTSRSGGGSDARPGARRTRKPGGGAAGDAVEVAGLRSR